jgi:valyl-tRNA synthetase
MRSGRFAGQFVFKANDAINQTLADKGALLAREKIINHSYPHCWRCKRPVIFRATPQWFISMEKNGAAQKIPPGDRPGQVDSPLGPRAHLRHDRKPAGLVRFPPARLGGSHYGLYLREM